MRVNILSDGRFLNSGRFRPVTNVRAALSHQGKYHTLVSVPRDKSLAASLLAYDFEHHEGERDTQASPSGKCRGAIFIAVDRLSSNDNRSITATRSVSVLSRHTSMALDRASKIGWI
jgi:hypothetical protein